MKPFSGLSAFPLTPLYEQRIDERAFGVLVERAVEAGVDSVTALGSTGSYAYLNRSERALVTQLAVSHAGKVPVIAGIGAVRTREILDLAEDAQAAGVAGVLLAPVSYQALTEDDVFGLYEDVTAILSVPLVVYDNPRHHTFHLHTGPVPGDRRVAERGIDQNSRCPTDCRRCGRTRGFAARDPSAAALNWCIWRRGRCHWSLGRL